MPLATITDEEYYTKRLTDAFNTNGFKSASTIAQNEPCRTFVYTKTAFLDEIYTPKHTRGGHLTISQRIWHIIHNDFTIKYSIFSGKPLKFHSLDVGYSYNLSYNTPYPKGDTFEEMCRNFIKTIDSYEYKLPFFRIINENINLYNFIINNTSFLPNTATLAERVWYINSNIHEQCKCIHTGELLVPYSYGTQHYPPYKYYPYSSADVYYAYNNFTDIECNKFILDNINSGKYLIDKTITKIVDQNTSIHQYIERQLGITIPKGDQLIYHLVNNIKHIPKCIVCGNDLRFHCHKLGYFKHCSRECSDKSHISRSYSKEYTLPSSKVVNVRGYEHWGLDYLLSIYNENDIVIGPKNIEEFTNKILYTIDGNTHPYYPDFYIKSQNMIVEVKSEYTFNNNKEINILKKDACIKLGYNYKFLIYNTNGKDVTHLYVSDN